MTNSETPVPGANIALLGGVGSGYNRSQRENIEFHPRLSRVVSGSDGSWKLDELPNLDSGGIKIVASHAEFAPTEQWIQAADLTNMAIVLSNGLPLFGRVLETNGI